MINSHNTYQHGDVWHDDGIIVRTGAQLRLEGVSPLVVEGKSTVLVVGYVHFLPLLTVDIESGQQDNKIIKIKMRVTLANKYFKGLSVKQISKSLLLRFD